jgi:phosphate transport system substrate-binding protein
MNDEFLYRLRKEPPPAFAARLRARLKLQTPAPRLSVLRMLVIGFVVGGSALAATLWAVKGTPRHDADAFVTREVAPLGTPPASDSLSRPATTYQRSAPTELARKQSQSAPTIATPVSSRDSEQMPAEEAEASSPSGVIGGALLKSSNQDSGNSAGESSEPPIRVAGPLITHALTRATAEGSDTEVEIELLDDDEAFNRFCEGTVAARPDLIVATRPMNNYELQRCAANGVRNIAAAKIGYAGIVLTATKTSPIFKKSARDVFLALAKQIPSEADPTRLIDNPNVTWRQVNPHMETVNIAVFGPAPNSALGKVVSEWILAPGCDSYPWIKALRESDPERYRRVCHTIREDGVYVTAEENNIFVSQRLMAEPNAMALLSFRYFDQQRDVLIGSRLDGAEPTMENIASGAYPYSRVIHVYTHTDRFRFTWRFHQEYLSMRAIGPNGYLIGEGLIPLDPSQHPVRAEVIEIPGSSR